jgi:hypothetical protein
MNPYPSFTHSGRRRRLLILPGLRIALAGVSLAADTDADGLDDSMETNTGIFVSATNTGTNPSVGDSDLNGATATGM